MIQVLSCFLDTVRRNSSSVAIEELSDRTITYSELSKEIHELARSLSSVDGKVVAIELPRSIDFVVALFGIWMAQKTALILDPDWPQSRVRSCLCEFDATALISRDGLSLIPGCASQVDQYCADPAYIILTSGTTGKPKGTVVGHDGICNVMEAQIEAFQLNGSSRSYWMHGIAFDASISDVGTVLLSGGTLVIDNAIRYEQLCRKWHDNKITHVDIPPALLPHLSPSDAPECLKVFIIGGQVADAGSVRMWCERVRVVNVYGPTEATICTSLCVCDRQWFHALIGQPISGIVYSIDELSGELLITGDGVAFGYYGQSELSSERFTVNRGIRTFHTRDQVRRLEDGSIEFLGRLDRQFKLHGKLICPEEIETRINTLAGVSHSVVLKHAERMHLVACVETQSVKQSLIIEYLEKTLPRWMIPSEWLMVEKLPVSKNGKVDAHALAGRLKSDSVSVGQPQPKSISETQAKLQAIFKSATRLDEFDLDLSFDGAGIDSMSVVQLLIEAEKAGFSLSAQSLKLWPSIRLLAQAIDSGTVVDDGRGVQELMSHIQALTPVSKLSSVDFGATKHILITGATGFFGSALMVKLIKRNPEVQFTCLVRGGDQSRVLQALPKHGYDDPINLICVAGDIELEHFGLSLELWRQLADQIDTVVHSAAKVNLVDCFESCFTSNVVGTANVMKFCLCGNPKRLHYISTLSVFVDATPLPEVCLESDELNDTEIVYGGYAQSKWAAERLVRASTIPNGISIYRLGLLTANSETGYEPQNDLFTEFVRDHDFGLADDLEQCCDFTPVNIAADQVAVLILSQSVGTWHICNSKKMTYGRLKARQSNGMVESQFPDISELALRNGHSPFRVFKTTNTRFSVENTELRLLTSTKS